MVHTAAWCTWCTPVRPTRPRRPRSARVRPVADRRSGDLASRETAGLFRASICVLDDELVGLDVASYDERVRGNATASKARAVIALCHVPSGVILNECSYQTKLPSPRLDLGAAAVPSRSASSGTK